MVYRFVKDYAHRVECIVEADSLEEAKEKSENEYWEDKEGDDYVILYFGMIALDPDDKPIESIEVIDEGEYDEDYYWDDLEDDDFFNRVK